MRQQTLFFTPVQECQDLEEGHYMVLVERQRGSRAIEEGVWEEGVWQDPDTYLTMTEVIGVCLMPTPILLTNQLDPHELMGGDFTPEQDIARDDEPSL